jgi:hypothetical protein
MKRSIVKLVTDLNHQLLAFPELVNKLKRKDHSFLDNLFAWIAQSEEILVSNSISQVSELSGLKSRILAGKYARDNNRLSKKEQLKVASECLYDIQHLVLHVLEPFEIKINESRELIRQMLLIISQVDKIKYKKNTPFEDFIHTLWRTMNSNEQLKGGCVKLKTVLSESDIFILIADEIHLEDFQ